MIEMTTNPREASYLLHLKEAEADFRRQLQSGAFGDLTNRDEDWPAEAIKDWQEMERFNQIHAKEYDADLCAFTAAEIAEFEREMMLSGVDLDAVRERGQSDFKRVIKEFGDA
jgi:hypothetical protein